MIWQTPNFLFDLEFTIYRKAQSSGSKLLLVLAYLGFGLRIIFIGLGNEFYKLEKSGQMDHLRSLVEKSGKKLFKGATDAIQFLKK